MKLVLCDKMIRAVARRFQNPGSSQFPNHQIGAAVFDVEYIRNMTGAEFVFISIAAEQSSIFSFVDACIRSLDKSCSSFSIGVKNAEVSTFCGEVSTF